MQRNQKELPIQVERWRSGKIVFNNKNSVLDCFVQKKSENLATLKIRNSMLVPEFFELRVTFPEEIFACEVVRKSITEIEAALSRNLFAPGLRLQRR